MSAQDRSIIIKSELSTVLQSRRPELAISNITFFAAGAEFFVFKAVAAGLGEVALRTAPSRWISDDNDPEQDARELQRQERRLCERCLAAGLPTVPVHDLVFDETRDILISAFVEDDGLTPDPADVGRYLKRLHRLTPPRDRLVADTAGDWLASLHVRMAHRAGVVERLCGIRVDVPRLEIAPQGTALLHLDVRRDNTRCQDGRIAALLDWSNALVGPPALEFARLAENGDLSDHVIEGYGGNPLADLDPKTERFLRLDTALMRAVLFMSEFPDPNEAARCRSRLAELSRG